MGTSQVGFYSAKYFFAAKTLIVFLREFGNSNVVQLTNKRSFANLIPDVLG